MFLGLMVVVFTFVVAINFILYFLLNKIAYQEIAQGLETSVIAYQRFDEQRRQLMLTQANSMAQTVHLKATLDIPDVDSETIYYVGESLKDIANPELMLIISAEGELLADLNDANLYENNATRISLMSQPGIENAFDEGGYYGIWKYDQHYFRVAISPIVVGAEIIGLITIGQRLDNPAAIRLAREIAGTEILISIDGNIHTSASEAQQQKENTTDLNALSFAFQTGKNKKNNNGIQFAEISLAAELFFTATLTDQDNLANTVFYRSTRSVTSSVDPVRIIILIASGLTILLGSLLSFRMSSKISLPIIKLTEVANEYGNGNLDLRINPTSRDEVGDLTNAFNGMADDIKANRLTLLQSLDAAEAANRAKSTFLATMSHEIRTPLNGVLGMADLLTNTELDNRQASLVNTINQSGQNLLDIISEILDFSKIEAGKLELNYTRFNLCTLIETIAELYASNAQAKGLELICAVSPEASLLIEGDELRLRQVLTNLLGNAIKFTQQGRIELRADLLELADNKACFQFEVLDTGIGIDQKNIDQIFQAFTQEDGTTTRKFGGTGLGLSISQHLVGLMGSVIRVSSQTGEGTCFSFDLSVPAFETPENNACNTNHVLSGKKVLVVDDIKTNRELLRRQLCSWGMACDTAASADECLYAIVQAATEKQPYHIVLLDCSMPDINVLELARSIENEFYNSNIHLALLNPDLDSDIETKARATGIRSIITKPVKQSALFHVLISLYETKLDADEDMPADVTQQLARQTRLPQINARVLVVEDTLVNQEVVMTMLDFFGCGISVASDGAEAVKKVQQELFDLILMDCQMPVMDGFVATAEIRKYEKSITKNRVPIIALTANAIEGDKNRCLQAGMDDYLSKPFNQQQLHQILLKWVVQKPMQTVSSNAEEQAVPALTTKPSINLNPAISDDGTDQTTVHQSATEIELIEQEVIMDYTALDQFQQLQLSGQDDLIARLINAFVYDSPKHIDNIIDAVNCANPANLSKAAHALKSSSENMGAIRLSTACNTLENIGLNDSIDQAESVLALLQETYEKTCSLLKQKQLQNKSIHNTSASNS